MNAYIVDTIVINACSSITKKRVLFWWMHMLCLSFSDIYYPYHYPLIGTSLVPNFPFEGDQGENQALLRTIYGEIGTNRCLIFHHNRIPTTNRSCIFGTRFACYQYFNEIFGENQAPSDAYQSLLRRASTGSISQSLLVQQKMKHPSSIIII